MGKRAEKKNALKKALEGLEGVRATEKASGIVEIGYTLPGRPPG